MILRGLHTGITYRVRKPVNAFGRDTYLRCYQPVVRIIGAAERAGQIRFGHHAMTAVIRGSHSVHSLPVPAIPIAVRCCPSGRQGPAIRKTLLKDHRLGSIPGRFSRNGHRRSSGFHTPRSRFSLRGIPMTGRIDLRVRGPCQKARHRQHDNRFFHRFPFLFFSFYGRFPGTGLLPETAATQI